MIPFGLEALTTVSLSLARRATKCLPRDGLVALYLFNEGAGQVLTDYSGNGNHGTLGSTTGDDTNDPTWTREGLAFETDDYVVLPDVNTLFASPDNHFTVTVAFTAVGKGTVLSRMTGGFESQRQFWIYILANGFIYVIVRGNTCLYHANPLNTPTALTLTWDGAELTAYVNGVPVTTSQPGTAAQQFVPLYLGCAHPPDGYYLGSEHAVGIWSRALSTAEVARAHAYLRGYLAKFGVVLS
jgi:hypothetical protein